MTKEEEKYLFWLTSLSGLGLPFVQRFFERYKSIDKARSLSETDIKKAEWMKPREKNYLPKHISRKAGSMSGSSWRRIIYHFIPIFMHLIRSD